MIHAVTMTAVCMTLVILSTTIVSSLGGLSNHHDSTDGNNRIETISNFQAVVDRIWLESTKTDTMVVFSDLDETLVMPDDVVFVYGLPRSDEFTRQLETSCDSVNFKRIGKEMERRYYDLPLTLLDQEAPAEIKTLDQDPVIDVFALTSRHYPANSDTENLIESLIYLGLQFTNIPENFDYSCFENSQGLLLSAEQESRLGGVIFANGESVNKGFIMRDFLNCSHYDSQAADDYDMKPHVILLDNTLEKLQAAAEAFQDNGIVFTGTRVDNKTDGRAVE